MGNKCDLTTKKVVDYTTAKVCWGSCVCLAEHLLWFVRHGGSSAGRCPGATNRAPFNDPLASKLSSDWRWGVGWDPGACGLSSGAPGNEVRYEPVYELTVHCFSICRNLQILLEFRFWKPVQRMPQM